MQKYAPWTRLKTFMALRTFLLLCASVGMSVVLAMAFLQRVVSSSDWFALTCGDPLNMGSLTGSPKEPFYVDDLSRIVEAVQEF
jgi:hypothetical protein